MDVIKFHLLPQSSTASLGLRVMIWCDIVGIISFCLSCKCRELIALMSTRQNFSVQVEICIMGRSLCVIIRARPRFHRKLNYYLSGLPYPHYHQIMLSRTSQHSNSAVSLTKGWQMSPRATWRTKSGPPAKRWWRLQMISKVRSSERKYTAAPADGNKSSPIRRTLQTLRTRSATTHSLCKLWKRRNIRHGRHGKKRNRWR